MNREEFDTIADYKGLKEAIKTYLEEHYVRHSCRQEKRNKELRKKLDKAKLNNTINYIESHRPDRDLKFDTFKSIVNSVDNDGIKEKDFFYEYKYNDTRKMEWTFFFKLEVNDE